MYVVLLVLKTYLEINKVGERIGNDGKGGGRRIGKILLKRWYWCKVLKEGGSEYVDF